MAAWQPSGVVASSCRTQNSPISVYCLLWHLVRRVRCSECLVLMCVGRWQFCWGSSSVCSIQLLELCFALPGAALVALPEDSELGCEAMLLSSAQEETGGLDRVPDIPRIRIDQGLPQLSVCESSVELLTCFVSFTAELGLYLPPYLGPLGQPCGALP